MMIDAHAVLAHLEVIGKFDTDESWTAGIEAWLRDDLKALPIGLARDEAGSLWVTLPGEQEAAVVLGSSAETDPGNAAIDDHFDLVVALETIKAIARRYEGRPPCTLQIVVWAPADTQDADRSVVAASDSFLQHAAAYLELQSVRGAQPERPESVLGMVVTGETQADIFNPRLLALCDEAIRELTGLPGSTHTADTRNAAQIAVKKIPAATMFVQTPRGPAHGESAGETRLHLLQAAEAFGRWAEATVHLVGGDEVDLWAREQRVPHSL